MYELITECMLSVILGQVKKLIRTKPTVALEYTAQNTTRSRRMSMCMGSTPLSPDHHKDQRLVGGIQVGSYP